MTGKASSLQGKPGSIELAAESHRKNGQNLRVTPHGSEVKNNKVAQMPPGGSPEKADASLVSLLKLPQDGLSRAVIAFARFFSLPLEPKLLAALRREALGARAAGREAAALGAAAAADKGIKLSEQALAEYAAAIEGGSLAPEDAVPASADEPQNAGRHGEDSQANDTAEREPGQEPENQDAGTGNNSRSGGGFRDDGNLQEGATELQRVITEILGKRPSLDLINRIPGKNGQWIVVPFSFSEDDMDITVSLRIQTDKALVSGRLSADIKVTRLGREQKRWLVTLERPEENSGANAELCVFSGSVPWRFSVAEKKQIRLELAAALDLPLDKVSIREEVLTGEADLTGEAIPVFAGSRESALRSVNEKV
ncbi:MAG: hypothetical protein LBB72_08085 [Spirochaetaceae bacterium]|nr:hypothetical protein [Spirochaetaceae bacterium]